jgi:hypothetical protein
MARRQSSEKQRPTAPCRDAKAMRRDPALKQFAIEMLPIIRRQYQTIKALPGSAAYLPGK